MQTIIIGKKITKSYYDRYGDFKEIQNILLKKVNLNNFNQENFAGFKPLNYVISSRILYLKEEEIKSFLKENSLIGTTNVDEDTIILINKKEEQFEANSISNLGNKNKSLFLHYGSLKNIIESLKVGDSQLYKYIKEDTSNVQKYFEREEKNNSLKNQFNLDLDSDFTFI